MALKITRPRHPELAGEQEKALEEARRLVKVKHPNVVRAFGAERVGDEIGLSMELVKGYTLDEIVRRQAPFSANEAAVIGIDLCRALAAVHGVGVLHGDIKAHNVMREDGGRTVLMDFGTSRDLNRQPPGPGGDFAGTPLYLAPEVFAGSSRTMQSEIYSVGVLLYFLVTGAHPFEGETRTAIGQLHSRHSPPKPLRDVRPDLPDPFIRVIERALAEDPSQRFPSTGAMETALAQLLGPGIRPFTEFNSFAQTSAGGSYTSGPGGWIPDSVASRATITDIRCKCVWTNRHTLSYTNVVSHSTCERARPLSTASKRRSIGSKADRWSD